jgi:hypothetical protein
MRIYTNRALDARAGLALLSDLTDAAGAVLEPFFRNPRTWAALADGRCGELSTLGKWIS